MAWCFCSTPAVPKLWAPTPPARCPGSSSSKWHSGSTAPWLTCPPACTPSRTTPRTRSWGPGLHRESPPSPCSPWPPPTKNRRLTPHWWSTKGRAAFDRSHPCKCCTIGTSGCCLDVEKCGKGNFEGESFVVTLFTLFKLVLSSRYCALRTLLRVAFPSSFFVAWNIFFPIPWLKLIRHFQPPFNVFSKMFPKSLRMFLQFSIPFPFWASNISYFLW